MKKFFYFTFMIFSLLCTNSCKEKSTPSSPVGTGGVIYGIAINAKTNTPIQGALITLMPNSENRYTGSDGTYQFNNLPTGKLYTLTAQTDGFLPNIKRVRLMDETPMEATFALLPE